MKIFFLFISLLAFKCCFSQTPSQRLSTSIAALETDEQFRHAVISIYVVDGMTGAVVFEKNAQTGVAPASCQKIITSSTAFELLGKDYSYKTYIACRGSIAAETLKGDLIISGHGDPTLGSWRWAQTTPESVLSRIGSVLKGNNIRKIEGRICIGGSSFSYNPVPDGWIWQDIGNYYGAGAWGFNWHENQYDLNLKSTGEAGSPTAIVSTVPVELKSNIVNMVTAAAKGTGDHVYIYAAPYSDKIFATGTIPVEESSFKVSGSIPDPPMAFARTMAAFFKTNAIDVPGGLVTDPLVWNAGRQATRLLDSIVSPPLDSINYWFLKRSINLYGEALVKTIAYEKNGYGQTDSGISVIRDFWSRKGIDRSALKVIDGSGLSPANRVTTSALVSILQYAKQRPWFPSFYFDLPQINDIKMKDGYINGVRSYSGYIKSTDGKEYVFSFIINNFDGNPGTVREKMWKILDVLK